MNKIITLFLLISIQPIVRSQIINPCGVGWGKTYKITSEDGLNLRDSPNAEGKILTAIPFDSIILSGPSCETYFDEINGKKGNWILTNYNGKQGFVFDFYIEETSQQNKIKGQYEFFRHGNEYFPDSLDKGEYFGLYLKYPKKEWSKEFEFKVFEEKDIIEKRTGGMKRGINFPILILSGLEEVKKTIRGKFVNRMLFPGDQESLSISLLDENGVRNSKTYFFYALGELKKNTKEFPIIKSIENYELRLYSPNSGLDTDLLLFKTTINAWLAGGYENNIYLKWIGDLNSDGEIDMIISHNFHYAGGSTTLYLSNNNPKFGPYIEIHLGDWGE